MIEFDDVDGAEAGVEEELDQPPPRGLPLGPRGRRLLAGLGVLAVGAAVVGYARLSGGARAHPAARSSATTSTHVPLPATVSPASPGLLIEHLDNPRGARDGVELRMPAHLDAPPCPPTGAEQLFCAAGHAVPAPFALAVHARFPHATHPSMTTVLTRGGPPSRPRLFTRLYRGHAGTATLVVLVSRGATGDDVAPIALNDGDRTIVYTRHDIGGFTVQAQLTGPQRENAPTSRMAALVADARLVGA